MKFLKVMLAVLTCLAVTLTGVLLFVDKHGPRYIQHRQQRRLIFLRRQRPRMRHRIRGLSFYLILVRQEHHAALVGEGDAHHRHVGALSAA
ncbi:MAG: hypothetical protein ACLVJH_01530 [Faecalibacterium prausnitzii]